MTLKIDKRRTYYKITKQGENHRELQYKTGIIKDILPFNDDPNDSCCEGGMYFTEGKNLPRFFSCGNNIRPIKLLKESKVVIDKTGDKARTNMFEMKDKISFEEWYKKLGRNAVVGDLRNFPKYCPNSIELWYKDVIKRIPDSHVWSFPKYCSNSIHLWYKDVIKRIPDSHVWFFPKYCSKSIHLWCKDVIKRISDKDLWYFPMYCQGSRHIWEKEHNKRHELK